MRKFSELNFKRTVNENIDTSKNVFIKLTEYANEHETAVIKGFFFTNGDYGKQVVAVTDKYNINMPSFAIPIFEEIESDKELLNELVNGAGATIGNFRLIPAKKGKHESISFDFME